jgi:acetyl esterase/lipase
MRTTLAILFVAGLGAHVSAQTPTVPLYPAIAPGSESWTQKETAYGEPGNGHIRNVVKPSLTLYLPDAASASGSAVIVAPGGGFRWLAWEKEGTLVAEWLQRHGVAGLVLKYRLNNTGTEQEFQAAASRAGGAGARGRGTAAPAPAGAISTQAIQAIALADGRQALRVARQHAAEWRIDPAKIGVMGFSAGGYVAVKMALEHDATTRPDFTGAIYTCCTTLPIGTPPDDVGPLFIASAANDPISSTGGPALFAAWTAAKKPAEMHIYAAGGHGFGMSTLHLPSDTWIDRFGDWLRAQGLMR